MERRRILLGVLCVLSFLSTTSFGSLPYPWLDPSNSNSNSNSHRSSIEAFSASRPHGAQLGGQQSWIVSSKIGSKHGKVISLQDDLEEFREGRDYQPYSLPYTPSDGDYDTWDVSPSKGKDPQVTHSVIQQAIGAQIIRVHKFNLTNPLNHFSIKTSYTGCPGMNPTSISASASSCVVATNAGFFVMQRGDCLGNVISDSKMVQNQPNNNANFGITTKNKYITGYITPQDVQSLGFTQLITGVGWLVRGGQSYVNESASRENFGYGFLWEKAPRVSIGHDKGGNLLIFEVDGNEFLDKGLDLYEWSSIIQQNGAYNAINLDGGGSATVYMNGKIINYPSDYCGMFPASCERHVTTITCIY